MSDSSSGYLSRSRQLVIAILAIATVSIAPILGQSQANDSDDPTVVLQEPPRSIESRADGSQELVTGQIVSATGEPVTGIAAEVFVNGEATGKVYVSDRLGNLNVPSEWWPGETRDDKSVALRVSDRSDRLGWYKFRRRQTKQKTDTTPAHAFRIVMLPLDRTVSGQLLDEDNLPVPGVRMTLYSASHADNSYVRSDHFGGGSWLASPPSDENGLFSLSVPAASSLRLRPEHPDWIRMIVSVGKEEDDAGALTLYPAGRIEGHVLNAETSTPMAGHTIFVQAPYFDKLREGFPTYASAKVSADGSYVIDGLPPAPFNVLHSSHHSEPQWTAPAFERVDVIQGRTTRVDFQVIHGIRVAGRVTEIETDKPLGNIHVGYTGAARPDSGAACMMVQTRVDGSYEFFVPPGVSTFHVAEGNRKENPDSIRTISVSAEESLEPLDLRASLQD